MTKPKPRRRLPRAVEEIARLNFEGNIIPHSWYQHIKLESGKPDLPAIIILAEIIYWYRPYEVLDESSGQPRYDKKFKGDMFQSAAGYYEQKFGLTKDQARKALKRLEDLGLIRRELREIVQRGVKMNNVMFVEPVTAKIAQITYSAMAGEDTAEPEETDATATQPENCAVCPFHKPADSPAPTADAPALIFDHALKDLTEPQRAQVSALLAGVPGAQAVLDELNSAVLDKKVKARKPYISYLKTLISRAASGEFVPTSDLPERRRKAAAVQQTQATNERRAQEQLTATPKTPPRPSGKPTKRTAPAPESTEQRQARIETERQRQLAALQDKLDKHAKTES